MRWALRAIAECPETREPWVQAEEVAYAMENWYGVYSFGSRALEIKEKSGTYINEDKAWGAYPWDAMAYAVYQMGLKDAAEECTLEALRLEPDNERLQKNLAFFRGGGAV